MVPPSVQVRAVYPGANPKVIAETVATPLEEAINGVENMMYMKSVAGSDGVLLDDRHLPPGHRPDAAQVSVQNRVSQALRGCPRPCCRQGVTTQKQSPNFTDGHQSGLARRHLRLAVPAQLRHACRSRTSWRACRASARRWSSAPATTPCASGSTRTRSPRAG